MKAKILFIGLFMQVLSPSSGSTVMNIRREINEEMTRGTVLYDLMNFYGLNRGGMAGRYFEQKGDEHLQTTHQSVNLSQDFIRVNREDGLIILKKEIDRDSLCGESIVCVLKIKIMTLPQRYFRLLKLNLVIKDVNDNPPSFPSNPIRVNVSEKTQINDVIDLDQYQAKDLDIGNNSRISYDLTPNRYFSLRHFYDEVGKSHLNLIVLKKLDFEIDSFLQFKLTAVDGGVYPQTSQSILIINVIDINDITPRFDRQNYVIFVSESFLPGSKIASVHADDFDAGTNGEVRYRIVTENSDPTELQDLLSIDPNNGEIKLLKQLSQETDNGLKFQVEATDMGDPPLSSRTWVTLEVDDVNDNSPVIDINFLLPVFQNKALLSESAPVDTYVGYVIATDLDRGNNGEVEMKIETMTDKSKVSGQFSLGSDGLLLTKKPFDREVVNQYEVKITACDKGSPPKCSILNITIKILDENDNSPVFNQSIYDVTLSESQEIGTEVITVTAFDNDARNSPAMKANKLLQLVPSSNGEITYSIYDKEETFSINSKSGQVVLQRALDRERLSSWEVVINARDSGEPANEATCLLRVTVTDVNDNPPFFTSPSQDNLTVYASIKIDESIIKIKMVDYDKGSNSVAAIRIKKIDDIMANNKDEKNLFQAFLLNQENGELLINRSYEHSSDLLGRHYIRLQATDYGTPPLKSEIGLFVDVTDWLVLPTMNPENPPNSFGFNSAPVNILLVIIMSSAGLLFIIVTVALIFTCKYRKKKQMDRSYDCRKAESEDESRQLQTSKHDSGSEEWPAVPTGNGVVALCDSGKVLNARPNHLSTNKNPRLSLSGSECSGAPYQAVTSRPSPLCPSEKYVILSTTSGSSMTPNRLTRSIKTSCDDHVTAQQLDMDSGRGDSEVESSCLQAGTDPKCGLYDAGPRSSLGKQCTNECSRFGHSDSCWMPRVVTSGLGSLLIKKNLRPETTKSPPILLMNQIKGLPHRRFGAGENPRQSLCLAVTGEGNYHRAPFRSEPAYSCSYRDDVKRHSRLEQLIGNGDSPYSSVFGSNCSSPAPSSGRGVSNFEKEKSFSRNETQSLLSKDHYLSLGGAFPLDTRSRSIRNVEL